MVVVSSRGVGGNRRGIVDIMMATFFWSALVVVLQAIAAEVVGTFSVFNFALRSSQGVFAFGCFSWLQALAAVVFGYADRFLVAAMLGTAPVAIYVLCVDHATDSRVRGGGVQFLFRTWLRHEAGEVDARDVSFASLC